MKPSLFRRFQILRALRPFFSELQDFPPRAPGFWGLEGRPGEDGRVERPIRYFYGNGVNPHRMNCSCPLTYAAGTIGCLISDAMRSPIVEAMGPDARRLVWMAADASYDVAVDPIRSEAQYVRKLLMRNLLPMRVVA